MVRGGPREGAGRRPGAHNRLIKENVEKAKTTGELPHEFLLRISRGEDIDGYTPNFQERVSAAQAVAPYFAPKLASIEQSGKNGEPIQISWPLPPTPLDE